VGGPVGPTMLPHLWADGHAQAARVLPVCLGLHVE